MPTRTAQGRICKRPWKPRFPLAGRVFEHYFEGLACVRARGDAGERKETEMARQAGATASARSPENNVAREDEDERK